MTKKSPHHEEKHVEHNVEESTQENLSDKLTDLLKEGQEKKAASDQAELAKLNQKVTELEKALVDAKEKAEESFKAALRKEAECQNIERRAAQKIEDASKFALERFANELLHVVDSIERGLELNIQQDQQSVAAIFEGMKLTYKILLDTLAKFGITQLNPMGEAFNPEYHEALSMQESAEVEPHTVLTVLSRGYMINGRLLRPARVVVSRAATTE